TNRKQCLVRSLPARPASGFAPSGDEQLEQSRRAAITRNESSHGLCRGHGRSHATILPPSNGAISRSSALQKDHTVFLVSSTPPLKTNDLYQMMLHPPDELARPFGNMVRRMTHRRWERPSRAHTQLYNFANAYNFAKQLKILLSDVPLLANTKLLHHRANLRK